MSRKGIQWMREELPGWVRDGLVTADGAEALRRRYGVPEERAAIPWALLVFGSLGGLLIGLGVILLVAHNWADLARPVRVLLAFLPMVAGQALAGWVALARPESRAWREAVGTFLFLAVGAAIALVAQAYHMPGDAGAFTLTWMLLALPLVYLLGASVPAVLYLAGLTAWAGILQSRGGQAVLFWPLAALAAPHIAAAVRHDRYGPRAVLLLWAALLTASVAVGLTLEKVLPGLWIVVYSGLFGCFYLAGGFWFADAPSFWRRPLHAVGAGGVAVLSLLFTYEWPWGHIGWRHWRYDPAFHAGAAWLDYAAAVVLPVLAIALLVTSARRGAARRLFFGVFPLVAIAGFAAAANAGESFLPQLLFNAYLLVLGVSTLVEGFREGALGTLNGGLLMLVVLIGARFFDADIGFVAKGLAFILLGAAFLATNLVLARRLRRTTP